MRVTAFCDEVRLPAALRREASLRRGMKIHSPSTWGNRYTYLTIRIMDGFFGTMTLFPRGNSMIIYSNPGGKEKK
jgi:hypothetical protein